MVVSHGGKCSFSVEMRVVSNTTILPPMLTVLERTIFSSQMATCSKDRSLQRCTRSINKTKDPCHSGMSANWMAVVSSSDHLELYRSD